MIKKVILVAGGAFLVAAFLFGRNAIGYFRTSLTMVRESAQNAVPVEFQIDHARNMIKDLTPEVRKNMHVIAKEEVELKRLEEQIAAAETRLAKEKEQVLRLKQDLAGGPGPFHYGTRSYTADQVKTDLANRFQRYKTGEATLASLKGIYEARQRSLAAARQRLDGMLAARRQLQVDVENLDARNQMVAAAQTASSFQFDESQLGRVKELLSNLRTRLDVSERLANVETEVQGEIPLDKSTPKNILDEIGQYFSHAGPDAAAVARQ
jgi:DNA repair exonuclease SbcCD ATPase subunit